MKSCVGTVAVRASAVLLSVTLLTAAQCPGSTSVAVPERAEQALLPDSADLVIFGMRMNMTDAGVNKGVLLADTAFSYDDGTRFELRQVNVTFHTTQGEEDGVLSSREGTYNMRLSRLEARGNVIVLAEDGRRLDTEQLAFDQQRNQIFSDSAFVLVRPPRSTLSGIGFVSDPKLTVFEVLKGAKGVTPVKLPVE